MIGEQLFRGHLVHVARLRVGTLLSVDGRACGDSRWVFSQRPAAPRPPSHGAREVSHRRLPLRIASSWSNHTSASGTPRMSQRSSSRG